MDAIRISSNDMLAFNNIVSRLAIYPNVDPFPMPFDHVIALHSILKRITECDLIWEGWLLKR